MTISATQREERLRVLLAEDEPFLGKIVKESLESRGFEVLWAQDGQKAYSAFRTYDPSICVFDVMMPAKDGFTLTEEIRQLNPAVPIIFLTAKSLTEDVVKGFGLGGNDYLKKPFSMEELIVRMNALLNRTVKRPEQETVGPKKIGNYMFNAAAQDLILDDETVKLSSREAELLDMLYEHRNRLLDRKFALDTLWGDDTFFNARSMDVFITKLRKRLQGDPEIEIVNVRGLGYKLIVNSEGTKAP